MTTDSDHILKLAEIIREVDGGNRLGAAALAEAILSHHGSRWSPAVEPEPEGPTDEELHDLWLELYGFHPDGPTSGDVAVIARAVLARWGRTAVEPPAKPSHHTTQHSSQRP